MKKEVIQAILDGTPVQYNRHSTDTSWQYCADTCWYDLGSIDDDPRLYASLFLDEGLYTNYVWRIKPEIKTIKVRIALLKNSHGFGTLTVNTLDKATALEKEYCFVGWLTYWNEYPI